MTHVSPLSAIDALTIGAVALILLWCYGRAFRRVLELIGLEPGFCESHPLSAFTFDVSLGAMLVPIVCLALTPLKLFELRFLAPLTFLLLALSVYDVLRRPRQYRVRGFKNVKSSALLLVLGLALTLTLRFTPILGLYAPPGDDPKMHALLVRLVVEEKGYPSSWGLYAPWSPNSPVMYPMEYHSIIALIYQLLGGLYDIPRLVLVLNQLFSLLLALAFFRLTLWFTKSEPSAATSLLAAGSIIPAYVLAFAWGSNSQLACDFIMLSLTPLLLEAVRARSLRSLVLLGVLMGYVSHFNVLSSAVMSLGLVLILISIGLKARWREVLLTLLVLALTTALMHYNTLTYLRGEKLEFVEFFSEQWWSQDLVISSLLLKLTSSAASTSATAQAVDLWSTCLLAFQVSVEALTSCLAIIYSRRVEPRGVVVALALWLILLVALNLNSPCGPYFIKFPGWYVFVPGRMLYYTSYPLIVMSSLGLYAAKSLSKRVTSSLALLVVLASLLGVCSGLSFMSSIASQSPVSSGDVEAFSWISSNIDRYSVILVSDADAGQWIPAYTGRPVIPMFVNYQVEPYVDREFWDEVVTIGGFHHSTIFNLTCNTSNPELLAQLLEKYGVEYVYVGCKTMPWKDTKLNTEALKGSGLFDCVYRGEAYIFKLRANG